MTEDSEKKLPKSLIRIIDILMRLLQGERINSNDAAQIYKVNQRTIYRDLQIIKENPVFNAHYRLQFDQQGKSRFVINDEKISTKEVLAIIQIIIGTRALSKNEIDSIIKDLRKVIVSEDQYKVDKFLKMNYLPVKTNGKLLDYIEEFTKFIEFQNEIEFTYQGSLPNSDTKRLRHGIPISLYFSDFYFYVLIFSEEKGSRVYRLDRILSYKSTNKSVNVPREKWEDGTSIRNFTYLLNGGRKSYFKIKYRGYPWTALDRLPNSRIVSHESDGSVIIEGYLYMQGLKHWVLGQGDFVKVLEPQSLIKEVKSDLLKTLNQYK